MVHMMIWEYIPGWDSLKGALGTVVGRCVWVSGVPWVGRSSRIQSVASSRFDAVGCQWKRCHHGDQSQITHVSFSLHPPHRSEAKRNKAARTYEVRAILQPARIAWREKASSAE
jgi:hypothetical protein